MGVDRCAAPPYRQAAFPHRAEFDIVSDLTSAAAVQNIYSSLAANNEDIDAHIAELKAALTREGIAEAVFEPSKLAQNNRQGRKLMQAYFKKRGVTVSFAS